MNFKPKGMNQDLSASAFSNEFVYENRNLRLSTNEGNTMLSWVTERGTEELTSISINGACLGHCVIGEDLVLFTKAETGGDYIYLVYKDTDTSRFRAIELYEGDLNFHLESPIHTLGYYESDSIRKVYWVDNINQPRLINISSTGSSIFNFAIQVFGGETLTINSLEGGGLFAPGTIQYCFTYIIEKGQESNIVAISPINYITAKSRAGNPEEKLSRNFSITVEANKTAFEENLKVRLYSFHCTSISGVPIVKRLADLNIFKYKYIPRPGAAPSYRYECSYIDTGMGGEIIDPSKLLLVGSRTISANTIAVKSNTLFMGGLTELVPAVKKLTEKYLNPDSSSSSGSNSGGGSSSIAYDTVVFDYSNKKTLEFPDHTNNYSSDYTLSHGDSSTITTFKGGEYYRFGYQLQTKTGEWSDPVYLEDKQNTYYPTVTPNGTKRTIQMVSAKATIDLSGELGTAIKDNYIAIRPLVVYPNPAERAVIAQGVLNPTVFNIKDRTQNAPFAQASWFFRPYMVNTTSTEISPSTGDEDHNNFVTYAQHTGFDPSNTRQVWCLLVDVPIENDNYTLNALKNHKCMWYGNASGGQERIDFDLIIATSRTYPSPPANPTHKTYALLRVGGQWPEPFFDMQVNTSFSSTTASGRPYYFPAGDSGSANTSTPLHRSTDTTKPLLAIGNTSSSVYTQLHNKDGCAYYYKPSDTDKDYFYITTGVTVPAGFNYIEMESLGLDSSDNAEPGKAGVPTACNHYQSLYNQHDQNGDNGYTTKAEIQGSKKVFSHIFDTSNKTKLSLSAARTQFFVDQSIVTLNSPDIEFDTDVQNSNLAGVSLHVIGAIPITASYSTCRMTVTKGTADKAEGLVNNTVSHTNGDENAGNRLVSEYMWRDGTSGNYLVFPWQNNGSISGSNENEGVVPNELKEKAESTLLYSDRIFYIRHDGQHRGEESYAPTDLSCQIALTENTNIYALKLERQLTDAGSNDFNYYPNIETALVNEDGYKIWEGGNSKETSYSRPIPMSYNSTSHAVIGLKGWKYLPYYQPGQQASYVGQFDSFKRNTPTLWGVSTPNSISSVYRTREEVFGSDNDKQYNFLWLGELRRNVNTSTIFGGKTYEALKANKWYIAGETVALDDALDEVDLEWTEGDTYYQRYDCLKTYPRTYEDKNQLVEILSFLCETRVNIDGRCDRNRGQLDNTLMSPQNFNILNPVYSQKNELFKYSIVNDTENNDLIEYKQLPNYVAYSLNKTSGAVTDEFTHVTLGSVAELEGIYGDICDIEKLNDQLIVFQEKAVSQILFDEQVQIPTSEGVPIEISNSGKLQGIRVLSDKLGCTNRASIVRTPNGIYFVDSTTNEIYRYNGEFTNISAVGGMSTWCKKNITDSLKTYYDPQNAEVLFTLPNETLAYSEKFGVFTSFYDYQGTSITNNKYNTFINYNKNNIWLTSVDTGSGNSHYYTSKAWRHQGSSDHCNFFGTKYPYSTTLVCGVEPVTDKTFTNLEMRACVSGEGITADSKYTAFTPFDSIEAWNEYQHGLTALKSKNNWKPFVHGTGTSGWERKFRVWRCDIPRDNYEWLEYPVQEQGESAGAYQERVEAYNTWLEGETLRGIYRNARHPNDRMRNPWLYIKLQKDAPTTGTQPKMELHDIAVDYFS